MESPSHERRKTRIVTALIVLGLALTILVPYWRLTSMSSVLITDDFFVSDVFGGEFPARTWLGSRLKAHEAPLWARDAGGGVPIVCIDPMTMLLFWALPPVIAMNVQLLAILILASVGTYAYARAVRCSRAGAALAAIAFSYSGFMVCQLKHVTAVEIVAWFPLALMLLERGLGPATNGRRGLSTRALALAWFGVVAALQILPGFPQTTYYCFLAYGGYGLARVSYGAVRSPRRRARAATLVAVTAGVVALGIGMGAVELLPLSDVAAWSERASTSYDWVSHFGYHWPNLLTFFLPYINGDVSKGTFQGGGIFWEEYGYVGLLTIVLAIGGAIALRRTRLVRVFAVMWLLSFLLVLGPALPGFRLVFELVPGMKQFRFTTRAMFLIDFALSMLAAFGVTAIERRISASPRWNARRGAVLFALVAIAFGDLLFHQLRQNAYGDVATFLEPPRTARFLREHLDGRRYLSLLPRSVHRVTHEAAHGWSDTRPYVALLPMLEPNTNLYWGLSSADVYTGLPPVYTGRIWGNENHRGVMDVLPVQSPRWMRMLRHHSVSHVVSWVRLPDGPLRPIALDTNVHIYEVPGALPRAYVATRVRVKRDVDDPIESLLAPDFVLGRDVIFEEGDSGGLEDGPTAADGHPTETPTVVEDRDARLSLDVDAPNGGVLVLTDNYIPIWRATMDGAPAPVLRANYGQRAVALTPGKHRIVFSIVWPAFEFGAYVGAGALAIMVIVMLRLRALARRSRVAKPNR